MARRGGGTVDYDEEGRKLLARLNLPVPDAGAKIDRYAHLNCVWQHPRSGGKVYTGSVSAAESASILQRHGITHIVNCQDVSSPNFHERDANFTYLRFPIAHWWSAGLDTPNKVVEFFAEYFQFVENATREGKCVLVHCLAGAHRAGTATIALLMHKANMDAATATIAAKKCRDIINPIGGLEELLQRFQKARTILGSSEAK